jgi:mannose-6-phosphate isomerase-like protein (cupin superfamily)
MEIRHHSGDPSRFTFDADVAPHGHITQIAIGHFHLHQSCPAHTHRDLHEVFVCESGERDVTVDTDEVDLGPGDVVLVRPGHLHSLVIRSESLCKMLLIGVACPLR